MSEIIIRYLQSPGVKTSPHLNDFGPNSKMYLHLKITPWWDSNSEVPVTKIDAPLGKRIADAVLRR